MLSRKQRWTGYWECSDRRKVWILFIYWSIVSLQYWVAFCHREVWVLNKVVKEGLTVKVSSEEKLEGSQGMSYEYSRQREPSVQRSWGRNRPGMWSSQSGWARGRERSGGWGQRVDSCVCACICECVVRICVLLWCLGREEQLLKGPPAGIWILPYFLSLILFCSSQLNHKGSAMSPWPGSSHLILSSLCSGLTQACPLSWPVGKSSS